MSKEIDTKIECCEIWNSLKDKTKMIDFLINAKTEIDQLKQENETLFLQLSKQEIDEHKPVYCTLAGNDCKYLGKIKELKQQLDKKDKMHLLDEQEFQHYCAYKLIETEIKGCLDREKQLEQKLAELKEKAIVLPVKIGDTIYVVPSETNYRLNIAKGKEEQNKVYEWTISEIRYNKYGFSVVCDVGDVQFYCNYEPPKNLCGHFDTEKYYGETWFTTRAEAQAKLQELRGGDE